MSESYRDAMQRELDLRKVRQAGLKLLKGRELYDFLGIKEKHDQERDAAEMLYRNEYKLRVDVAYQMLLKRATSKAPELKPRFVGHDRLNPSKLIHNAQKLVRFEHNRTMARLDARELKESTSFMEKCTQRTRYVEAFKSASRQTRKHTPTQSPTMND